tara:strand:- start:346 stop:534 length:189 start_codon:yes stop_codon:yes gene_type:complete
MFTVDVIDVFGKTIKGATHFATKAEARAFAHFLLVEHINKGKVVPMGGTHGVAVAVHVCPVA